MALHRLRGREDVNTERSKELKADDHNNERGSKRNNKQIKIIQLPQKKYTSTNAADEEDYSDEEDAALLTAQSAEIRGCSTETPVEDQMMPYQGVTNPENIISEMFQKNM
ncbi:unnamed protein product [Amoebophrya sp. A25]|nr:unnamed protein product [Amoebophrya sp. A25]|eukprot:GSA25T00017122001.1